MSKPGADPSSGISLGDALRLPKRHPACRWREAQSGSGTERENLAGDVKGKGASGSVDSVDTPQPVSAGTVLQRSVLSQICIQIWDRRMVSPDISHLFL